VTSYSDAGPVHSHQGSEIFDLAILAGGRGRTTEALPTESTRRQFLCNFTCPIVGP
jgi:hypothetical protein